MKKTISYFCFLFLFSIQSYSQNTTSNRLANPTKTISNLITYTVTVRDTVKLKNVLTALGDDATMEDYNYQFNPHVRYLDEASFAILKGVVTKYISDKNAFAISPLTGKRCSTNEFFKRNIICGDSVTVEMFDANGNSFYSVMPGICDSSAIVANIKQIEFYETWTVDERSYEFKKEVLGFGLYGPIIGKEDLGYVEYFSIFPNEKNWSKVVEYKK